MKLVVVVGVSALMLLLSSAGATADQSSREVATTNPGEGVLCLWALTTVASEVGKHCPGKSDPAFQAVLNESVSKMDRYVAANGKWSAGDIDSFKKRQGGVGEDTAKLCTTDALQIFDAIRSQGATALRAEVDKAVARPGNPAWGDCV